MGSETSAGPPIAPATAACEPPGAFTNGNLSRIQSYHSNRFEPRDTPAPVR
jgi:hypothetical protein